MKTNVAIRNIAYNKVIFNLIIMKNDEKTEPGTPTIDAKYKIEILAKGPYIVHGKPTLEQKRIINNEDGEPWDYIKDKSFEMQEVTSLCRCGESKNKPYCDGAHTHANWNPELTAPMTPLLEDEDAQVYSGPDYDMFDNPDYCVHVGICMAKNAAWRAVRHTDDPERKAVLEHEVERCPSGRLKLFSKEEKKFIEPDLKPSLAIIEDTKKKCSGPLWVMGGIPIVRPDGETYVRRNRVTLCRCGQSHNKPYCDGSHVAEQWKDNL